jgi:hypothetical protein
VNLPGQTGATLELTHFGLSLAGLYMLSASNSFGSVTSAVVQISFLGMSMSRGGASQLPALTLAGGLGDRHRIEFNSKLTNSKGLITLTNATLTASLQTWIVDTGTNSMRFYRATALP